MLWLILISLLWSLVLSSVGHKGKPSSSPFEARDYEVVDRVALIILPSFGSNLLIIAFTFTLLRLELFPERFIMP
jgi:hypothetical protein